MHFFKLISNYKTEIIQEKLQQKKFSFLCGNKWPKERTTKKVEEEKLPHQV